MDIFLPIVLCLIFIILFSLCGWCCKRHREGTVYGYNGTPVTVTTTHVSATPVGGAPPYPVEPMHPTPHTIGGPPPVGFAPPMGQIGGYPPYMGYPPVSGAAPYPPAAPYSSGPPPQTAPPPSYSEAVAQPQPPMPNLQHDAYAKQAPYNPNYQ